MKGLKIGQPPLKPHTFTYIPTCEKGIYETHQLEAQRENNYKMIPIEADIIQSKNYRGDK